MKDYYLFIKRFISDPSRIGSIFPSSKKLADEMTKKLSSLHLHPLRILEVGAGSGAVTRSLVKKMKPGDKLDIVEKDLYFCRRLKNEFGGSQQIKIYQRSILHHMKKEYDLVISSLPLNSFPSPLVSQVLLKYKYLVKPGGYISYFEYIGLKNLKMLYLKKENQVDFETILALKNNFQKNFCTEWGRVWKNIPPARVFHCQIKKDVTTP